ncbi:65-kDa microtubule-associated protein 5-like isoform X1 [Malus sylvestris]|uniref:65-kDa microtubule-associated protein 5-like isoform X1 n=1 Tax=Malus sylvestris TaxID=3752 RepID=UPI0021ACD274|nr:65-kDa microtubule-associated protein 5-like isoform X1 [Malus sylvestris]
MLLQLEQECLDIYRKKIEMTRKHRADLHRYLPDGQTQIKDIVSALGKLTPFLAKEGPSKTNCLPSNLVWTNWNPVPLLRRSTLHNDRRVRRISVNFGSKNGFKNNLMQNRRQSLVQGLLQRSHWDKAPALTIWLAHQSVDVHPWAVIECLSWEGTQRKRKGT